MEILETIGNLFPCGRLVSLGHALFLHAQSGGISDVVLDESSIEENGDEVRDLRLYREERPPAIFAPYLQNGLKTVDYWSDIRWTAPSMLVAHNGCSAPGRARDGSGVDMLASHLLTPESQHSTHYFYAHSRNYRHDDDEVDEIYRRWQRAALRDEDSLVAEAIDANLAEAAEHDIRMVMLSTDQSGMRANRIVDRLAAAEA